MNENESALLLLKVQEATSNSMKTLAMDLKNNPSLNVLQPSYTWFSYDSSQGLEARFQADLNASSGSDGMAWTIAIVWSDSRWTVECLFSKLNIESGDESVVELLSEGTCSFADVEQLIDRAAARLGSGSLWRGSIDAESF